MSTTRESVKAALLQQPGRYLLKELCEPYSARKADYCSLREKDGRELMHLDGATVDMLAREGVVKGRPYGGEGFHRFDQPI